MLYSMQTCMRFEKYEFSWTRIPITNNPFKITKVLKYKERALRKKLIYSTQIFIGHIVLLLFVIRLLIMRQGYNWRASKGTMTCLSINFLSNFWNSLLNVMLILCWRKYWPEWFERQFSICKTWVSFFLWQFKMDSPWKNFVSEAKCVTGRLFRETGFFLFTGKLDVWNFLYDPFRSQHWTFNLPFSKSTDYI